MKLCKEDEYTGDGDGSLVRESTFEDIINLLPEDHNIEGFSDYKEQSIVCMTMGNTEDSTVGIAIYNEISFEDVCKNTGIKYNRLGAFNTYVYFLKKLSFNEKQLYLQSFLSKLNEKNINFVYFSQNSRDYDIIKNLTKKEGLKCQLKNKSKPR